MSASDEGDRVPLSAAALRLRLNREQLIRRIQRGEIAGGQEGGKWFVERTEVERLQAASTTGS